MSNKIDTILHDLYKIDPQFKKHEAELRKIVSVLLKSEPNTAFDASFARKLRNELLTQFKRETIQNDAYIRSPYFSFSNLFISVRTWAPLALIILLLPFSYKGAHDLLVSKKAVPFSVQQEIDDKGAEAFGTLSVPAVAKNNKVPLLPELTPTPTSATLPLQSEPTSQGGENTVAPMAATLTGPRVEKAATFQVTPAAPFASYVYKGDILTLQDATGKVYKRALNDDSSNSLSSIVQSFSINAVDLDEFKNLKPRTLELAENGPLAYVINVDFVQGLININPDWSKWNALNNASGEYTIPDDTTLIKISDQFLKDHGVNMSLYAKPVVMHTDTTEVGDKVTAADAITVIYPITIDGLTVYDENAEPYGLNVTVNIKAQKVASVINLTSQKYESASYELLTDFNAVLREATSTPSETTTTHSVTFSLSTPQRVLMKIWKPDASGNSTEIYVPAFLFKTVNEQATSTATHPVIVPLTKQAF